MKKSLKKKTIKLSEKVWEDFVWEYPSKFLEKGLKKFTRQYSDKSGRSDLVFKDKDGDFLVVEIQMKGIDRKHMHRAMDYRDDLCDKKKLKENNVRILLLCNTINEKQMYYLERHKLELKTISELKVRKIIREIDPRIQFTESKEAMDHYNDLAELKVLKEKDRIRTQGNLLIAYEKYPDDNEFISDVRLSYIKKNRTIRPALKKDFFDLNANYNDEEVRKKYNHIWDSPEIILFKMIDDLTEEIKAIAEDGNENFYYTFFSALKEIKKSITHKHYHNTLYDFKNIDYAKIINENRKPSIDLIVWPGTHYTHYDTFWLYWQPSNWIYYNNDLSDTDADFKFNKKQLYRWEYSSSYKDRWPFNIFCFKDEMFQRKVINNLSGRYFLILNNIIHYLILDLSRTFNVTFKNKCTLETEKLNSYEKILLRKNKILENTKVKSINFNYNRDHDSTIFGPDEGRRD